MNHPAELPFIFAVCQTFQVSKQIHTSCRSTSSTILRACSIVQIAVFRFKETGLSGSRAIRTPWAAVTEASSR